MPWCGYWGTAGISLWWVLPLIGVVVMGAMVFFCFRRFGVACMGGRRRSFDEFTELHREVEALKDEIGKLKRQPN